MAIACRAPKRSILRRFRKDETGSMTVWGLFVWFVSGILGAIALDYTHLVASRTHLQVVSDQAAHAAIYLRYVRGESADVSQIKTDAANLALASLPAGKYGTALAVTDINFGTFDSGTRTFTVDESAVGAVRARAYFNRDRGNAATSFLFRLIGRDDFNVAAEAVFIAYGDTCLNDGFVANGYIDITSNNRFGDGFCVHANQYVAVQQNNEYQYHEDDDPLTESTIVSMPDLLNLGLPGGVAFDESGNITGDFELNENLDKIIRSDYIPFDLVMQQVENMIARYRGEDLPNGSISGSTPGFPEYITDTEIVSVSAGRNDSIKVSEILAAGSTRMVDDGSGVLVQETADPFGRVYEVGCKSNGRNTGTVKINADPDTDVELFGIMVISDCNIQFSEGSVIRNSRVISTSTDEASIQAPSDLTVGSGNAFDCMDGAQFITRGGVDFSARVNFNASQIIAKGSIDFQSNGDGSAGVSLIAGENITTNANGNVEVCDSAFLDQLAFKRIRMVM